MIFAATVIDERRQRHENVKRELCCSRLTAPVFNRRIIRVDIILSTQRNQMQLFATYGIK